jgi:signal peptidase I
MKAKTRAVLLFILDVLLNVVVIVILVVLIRSFVISPFQVSGPSMCDTFNNFEGRCIHGNGEYIMIYKFGYLFSDPDRGDVVVFTPPQDQDGDFFIKRVIGLPGDTVEIIEGDVYVKAAGSTNSFLLDESEYLNTTNLGNTEVHGNRDKFEVPDDQFLVFGDNRKVSSDSRRCFEQAGCNGTNTSYITMDHIQGRAWVVLWPFDRMRFVGSAEYDL